MGFFDTLGEVAKGVGKSVMQEAEKRQKEQDRAYANGQRMSDRELVRKFKNASGSTKIGYARVLEDRGYFVRDSEGKFVRTSKRLD